jgi:hypothetical protein
MHHIVSSCQKAKNIIEDLKSDPTLKPITSQVWVAQNNFDIMMLICFYFQHTNALLRQVKVITSSPLCLPRYFFQTLQCTTVKVKLKFGSCFGI